MQIQTNPLWLRLAFHPFINLYIYVSIYITNPNKDSNKKKREIEIPEKIMSEEEIVVPMFDYNAIQPYHCILIIDDNSHSATALINRILRVINSNFGPINPKNQKKPYFEQGSIFTRDPSSRFRYPKRVIPYDKKQFSQEIQDIYHRQAFLFPFTSQSEESHPLHFFPKSLLSQTTFSTPQFMTLNKLMRIPKSFLVLHHCFDKVWPKGSLLNDIITQRHKHHRLLIIVTCTSTQAIPKEICQHFDWIFYFPIVTKTMTTTMTDTVSSACKKWYRNVFNDYIPNVKSFVASMTDLKPSQGIVTYRPFEYKDIADSNAKFRKSLLEQLETEDRLTYICGVKRLRFKSSGL